jgi:hypothetical protein
MWCWACGGHCHVHMHNMKFDSWPSQDQIWIMYLEWWVNLCKHHISYYKSVVLVTCEIIWLQNLLIDLGQLMDGWKHIMMTSFWALLGLVL